MFVHMILSNRQETLSTVNPSPSIYNHSNTTVIKDMDHPPKLTYRLKKSQKLTSVSF